MYFHSYDLVSASYFIIFSGDKGDNDYYYNDDDDNDNDSNND
jgi:hypothetical protein